MRLLLALAVLLVPAALARAQAPAIAAGEAHTCALRQNGTAACWGGGLYGQRGDGVQTQSQATPQEVRAVGGAGALTDAAAITAGANHTCVLHAGGAVACWGWGLHGQRGDGSTAVSRTTPQEVQAVGGGGRLSGATAITAGGLHTCALLPGGTVACWGLGDSGQRGDGTTTRLQTAPVVVRAAGGAGPLTGATALAAGAAHTCAILQGGAVACWGAGGSGQRGDGNAAPVQAAPQDVRAIGGEGKLSGVTALAAGGSNTCAILQDGTVACWGYGVDGQRGDGVSTEVQPTPVVVLDAEGEGALRGATALAVGWSHTCARVARGAVVCWGSGVRGRLGDGTETYAQMAPVAVRAVGGGGVLTGVTAIAAGFAHTCALLEGGTAACWGEGTYGQRGDGSTTQTQTTPVAVQLAGGAPFYVPVEAAPSAAGAARLALSPNPAGARATVTLTLPTAADGAARVALYDVLGREVAVLFDGHAAASQSLALDVSSLAPGVYVVRAITRHDALTKTLVVAR